MILVIGHDATISGAPKSLLFFLRWLIQTKSEKAAVILRNGGPLLSEYKKLAPVFVWNEDSESQHILTRIVFRIFKIQRLKRVFFLNRFRGSVQVVYSNTCTNGQILEKINKTINCRIVSRIAELEYAILWSEHNGFLGDTFALSNEIIAVSNAVKENLILNHQIDSKSIHVCYGSVPSLNQGQNCSSRDNKKDVFTIGGCGSIGWVKGTDMFVDLASLIKKQGLAKKYHLIWIGADLKSINFLQLKRRIEILNVEDIISFFPKNKSIDEYYEKMDAFFMSSREDSFPLVVIEAAQKNLPILCFEKAGGATEFVTEDCGYKIEFENVSQVFEKLETLRLNPKKRERLGVNAKKRSALFNKDTSFKKIYNILTAPIEELND